MIFIITLFSGCGKNSTSTDFFQTNSASLIVKNYENMYTQLAILKTKLDKRNPNQYNKDLSKAIYFQLKNLNEKVTLRGVDNKILTTYKEYLDIAFLDENIKNRNDYLILGIYHMIYDSFSLKKGHKFTAFNFNENNLQKLYKNLHILKWKLKSSKRKNGNYFFVTWQNNWQLDLMKKSQKDLNIIKSLRTIKSKEESLFSSSNNSFEVLLSLMINDVRIALEGIGGEPNKITFEALTTLVFLI